MTKPKPKKDAECEGCHEVAPLLMPVGAAPGHPIIMWSLLCLRCRLNERSDPWMTLEWEIKHSKRKVFRDVYADWLKATV